MGSEVWVTLHNIPLISTIAEAVLQNRKVSLLAVHRSLEGALQLPHLTFHTLPQKHRARDDSRQL